MNDSIAFRLQRDASARLSRLTRTVMATIERNTSTGSMALAGTRNDSIIGRLDTNRVEKG